MKKVLSALLLCSLFVLTTACGRVGKVVPPLESFAPAPAPLFFEAK